MSDRPTIELDRMEIMFLLHNLENTKEKAIQDVVAEEVAAKQKGKKLLYRSGFVKRQYEQLDAKLKAYEFTLIKHFNND